VNAVFIEPTFAYSHGLLRFQQPLSRIDAIPLPKLVLLYITRLSIMRDLTRMQIWRCSSIDCIVRLLLYYCSKIIIIILLYIIISHASAILYKLEYSIKYIQSVTYGNDSDEHFH